MLSKERDIFKNIHNKGLDKIDELSKTIDYGYLKFIVNRSGLETDFSELKYPVAFLDSIKKGAGAQDTGVTGAQDRTIFLE